ncbi:O-antigen ligase family protein [Rouxiella sp. WC2420]|uniref:O-antigen ligase family protein n=1 Tax=Rouxiella sp. WC2420 TaxID=3234145 RepID=A0AB39VR12_9GAMM
MARSNVALHSAMNIKPRTSMADYLLSIFLYISIVLPSGSILGINVKIISLLLFFLGLLLLRHGVIIPKIIMSLVPIFVFLFLELTLSLFFLQYDDSYMIAQAKDIFVFFLMFYVCIIFAENRNGLESLMDKITSSIFVVGIIKILILVYSFVTGIQISTVIQKIADIYNVSIMSFDVEDSSISRINFTSDSIIFICIFYLFMKMFRGKFSKKDILYLMVICFSALITMSRFQWATCLASILFAVLINVRKKKSFIVMVLVCAAAVFSLSFQSVQEMITTRFDQKLVSSSDGARDLQRVGIEKKIDQSPILGNGIGYYIPDVIRSSDAKYSYELQLLALIMQLGMIGFLAVMIMILLPLLKAALGMSIITYCCFTIMTFVWISGALFNPILFSSSAGAAMAALYAIAKIPWMQKSEKI